MKILIIEDNLALLEVIKLNIEKMGFQTILESSGERGMEKIKIENPDLVIADKNIPGLDGLKICETVKTERDKYGEIPVIMITGEMDERLKKKSMECGAIHFMEKPIDFEILELKINNLARILNKKKNILKYKNIKLDKERYKVFLNNEEIGLYPKEYEVLIYILENIGKVVLKKKMIKKIWEHDHYKLGESAIYTNISRLKKKFLCLDRNLQNIRGKGYILKVD